MTEDAKKPLKLVDTPPPEDIFNDIEELRKVATLKVSRRVVTVNVAVKRPPNNVYFRCHESPRCRSKLRSSSVMAGVTIIISSLRTCSIITPCCRGCAKS